MVVAPADGSLERAKLTSSWFPHPDKYRQSTTHVSGAESRCHAAGGLPRNEDSRGARATVGRLVRSACCERILFSVWDVPDAVWRGGGGCPNTAGGQKKLAVLHQRNKAAGRFVLGF